MGLQSIVTIMYTGLLMSPHDLNIGSEFQDAFCQRCPAYLKNDLQVSKETDNLKIKNKVYNCFQLISFCYQIFIRINIFHLIYTNIYYTLVWSFIKLYAKQQLHQQKIMGNQGSKGTGNQSGKGGPVTKTSQAPPVDSQQQKAIKIQKTMLVLDRSISQFADKEKKSEYQIQQLKAKAKELLAMDKKTEAKKYLEQATRIKKQSENFAIRRKVLQNKKFQLETAAMDKSTVGALSEAQDHLKDQDKINDKLQQIIIETNEQKMVQEQLNDKLKDMAGDDDLCQDVDDLLAQLQGEVKKQKQKNIPAKTVTTNAQVQKQKQTHTQDDEISRMMAEL